MCADEPTMLSWHFAQALRLVEDDPETEWDVRVALESTLRPIPRLAFLAPAALHLHRQRWRCSPDETRLATASVLTRG